MILSFDLDGVLYDFHESLYNELRWFHGLTIDRTEFFKNNDKYMSDEEWYNYTLIPFLFSNRKADAKVVAYLNKLSKAGHTIYYVTSRPEEIRITTERWLKNEGFPQAKNLIITLDKVQVFKELKPDYYFEDRVDLADNYKDLTNVILIRKPWYDYDNVDYLTIGSVCDMEGII